MPLDTDDLIVFFTDGISETMNEAFDCYGEQRLAKVLEQYAHLPFEQLRSFIFADLRAFAGAADQHDDMTMIMMKVEAGWRAGRGGVGMAELTVIFRTASNIEASVVQALLDSHGIESVRTSGPPASLFPFTVNPMGETRVSVREDDAEEAVRIIESHREQVGGGLVVPLPQQFAALEARLGYRFRDRGLLEHALTHKSKAHEDPSGGVIDNESLEFLGDAVLGLVIADALCRTFPDSSEGQKSKIKAMVVSTTSLAELAERLQLGDHMILGRGEEKTGGRRKQALLADTCEALIAAIYLDGGLEPARQFILRELGEAVEQARHARLFRPRSQVTAAGRRCRASAGRCRTTASPAKSVPSTASCSTSKSSSAAKCSPRASGGPRRTRSRTRPRARCGQLKKEG